MPKYTQILAVIQESWNDCWAASTSWWLGALSDKGRPQMTQLEVKTKFPHDWDKNGAMTIKGLADIFRYDKFKMQSRFGNYDDMNRIITKLSADPVKAGSVFPIMIGYNDTKAGGNHVAVLAQFDPTDTSYTKFVTMDPGSGYTVRKAEYFKSSTMVYAWPSEAGDFMYAE